MKERESSNQNQKNQYLIKPRSREQSIDGETETETS